MTPTEEDRKKAADVANALVAEYLDRPLADDPGLTGNWLLDKVEALVAQALADQRNQIADWLEHKAARDRQAADESGKSSSRWMAAASKDFRRTELLYGSIANDIRSSEYLTMGGTGSTNDFDKENRRA